MLRKIANYALLGTSKDYMVEQRSMRLVIFTLWLRKKNRLRKSKNK